MAEFFNKIANGQLLTFLRNEVFFSGKVFELLLAFSAFSITYLTEHFLWAVTISLSSKLKLFWKYVQNILKILERVHFSRV